MILKEMIGSHTYTFNSIKEVLAKASEQKSGDTLAGVGACSKMERVAAKEVLARLTVGEITENPAVPYDKDSVTRIIIDDLDRAAFEKVKNVTMADLREWILAAQNGDIILEICRGLTSEVIAATAKLMGNLDLMYASKKLHIEATCNTTIGGENVLASRLQPNHPIDDGNGVIASTLEGLSYGVGDAVLGLNPAIDTVESTINIWNMLGNLRDTFQIPTQTCVLSHVTTQMNALKTGAKADLCFQSIAGSQAALDAFGVTVEMLEEANAMFRAEGSAKGPNVMYFETGQGSELSSNAHFGADQGVMENRCYGLARHYKPFLVNTVVGFMGPEYVFDAKELLRAGLEDVYCGHMHGLPMGCDCCYTNHMPTDQNDIENLFILLAAAGCHYVMGLPQGDDVMLMYQSTGYHDVAAVRELTKKTAIPEFDAWLQANGIWVNGKPGENFGDPTIFIR
ncbi:MAG: ethanolamine ammonia-lyase subunit EutB [Lachnospiraceae bacterium]|nr:ethanolamine ammonia-lyase subunit EutB [Lachnospiraceae bacterium]